MAKGHKHAHVSSDLPVERDGRWAPLNTGFLIASILGFFISLLYISKFSVPMAVAFAVVFFCMFLASMISMARASPDAQLAAKPIK